MAEVGKATGKKTQANRKVYETPDGKMVSEQSTTFKHKGKWVNVPTIHNGYSYDDETLRMMLDAEVIQPTSTHKSKDDAMKPWSAPKKVSSESDKKYGTNSSMRVIRDRMHARSPIPAVCCQFAEWCC